MKSPQSLIRVLSLLVFSVLLAACSSLRPTSTEEFKGEIQKTSLDGGQYYHSLYWGFTLPAWYYLGTTEENIPQSFVYCLQYDNRLRLETALSMDYTNLNTLGGASLEVVGSYAFSQEAVRRKRALIFPPGARVILGLTPENVGAPELEMIEGWSVRGGVISKGGNLFSNDVLDYIGQTGIHPNLGQGAQYQDLIVGMEWSQQYGVSIKKIENDQLYSYYINTRAYADLGVGATSIYSFKNSPYSSSDFAFDGRRNPNLSARVVGEIAVTGFRKSNSNAYRAKGITLRLRLGYSMSDIAGQFNLEKNFVNNIMGAVLFGYSF